MFPCLLWSVMFQCCTEPPRVSVCPVTHRTVPCWFHQPFQCLSGIVRVSCMSSPWWHSIHSPVNSGPTFRCYQTELWGAWCLQGSWRKASQDTVKTIPCYLPSRTAKTPVCSCLLSVLKCILSGGNTASLQYCNSWKWKRSNMNMNLVECVCMSQHLLFPGLSAVCWEVWVWYCCWTDGCPQSSTCRGRTVLIMAFLLPCVHSVSQSLRQACPDIS